MEPSQVQEGADQESIPARVSACESGDSEEHLKRGPLAWKPMRRASNEGEEMRLWRSEMRGCATALTDRGVDACMSRLKNGLCGCWKIPKESKKGVIQKMPPKDPTGLREALKESVEGVSRRVSSKERLGWREIFSGSREGESRKTLRSVKQDSKNTLGSSEEDGIQKG
ncbi:unnamed protein product [Haemonchus placei]|uniref:Testis development-related protein n=1 Tax=Haemonchus placei TaxID=6290 RepID=A0A0N4WJM1_HAEPC|nr:unnamed protein product [Haemonchus placei]